MNSSREKWDFMPKLLTNRFSIQLLHPKAPHSHACQLSLSKPLLEAYQHQKIAWTRIVADTAIFQVLLGHQVSESSCRLPQEQCKESLNR